MAGKQMSSTKQTMLNKSVAGGPLAIFSKDPPTGYFKDGYCRTGKEDPGNHSIAAVITPEFLDFTTSKGNNLKDAGVKSGTKWCLCAGRWQEAYDAFKNGDLKKEDVPQVFLHATDEAALKTVSYKSLKEFQHMWTAAESSNRQPSHYDADKSDRSGSIIKETTELAGERAKNIDVGRTSRD